MSKIYFLSCLTLSLVYYKLMYTEKKDNEQKTNLPLSVFWINISKIDPNPFQPRKEFREAELESLSQSIRRHGVLQPLIVTKKEDINYDGNMNVRYELIAGERRLRASKLAGLTEVPVVIRTDIKDDNIRLELAIIENLQREDLNPVDRANAFKKLIEEFSMTHSEVAQRMGRSREYISNSIRLLTLPDDIINAIVENKISEGHTRPLLMLSEKVEEQRALFNEIVNRKITVREAEILARRQATERVRKYTINKHFQKIENTIEYVLETRVQIQKQGNTGGKILIDFFSDVELEEITKKIINKNSTINQEYTEKILDSDDDQSIELEKKLDTNDYTNDEDLYNFKNFSL